MSQVVSPRSHNLDLLKILACVAVVGLHTLNAYDSVTNTLLYYLCGFSVPLFFMASGYILLHRPSTGWRYVGKKLLAILKIVVLWNSLFFVKDCVVAFLHKEPISLLALPTAIVGCLVQRDYLWHFWYFGALLLLYLFLPLLSRLHKQLSWIWLGLVCIGAVLQLLSYLLGYPVQAYIPQSLRMWSWLQYFILGGLLNPQNDAPLFRPLRQLNPWVYLGLLVGWTVTVLTYQLFTGDHILHNTYAEYFYDSLFTVVWVIFLFTGGMRLSLSARAQHYIGRLIPLTVGIYIVHPVIRLVLHTYLSITSVGLSLVYFGGVLLVSALFVWSLIRIPLIRDSVRL